MGGRSASTFVSCGGEVDSRVSELSLQAGGVPQGQSAYRDPSLVPSTGKWIAGCGGTHM